MPDVVRMMVEARMAREAATPARRAA
jgi:hypothetical protein